MELNDGVPGFGRRPVWISREAIRTALELKGEFPFREQVRFHLPPGK